MASPPASHRPATLLDVARLASVSASTASKAMNGTGQLRSSTRQRVLVAARELGYEPNQLARGLISGRTYTVGVLSTDHYGRFTMPILTGAEDALGPGQLSMLLCESRGDPIRETHYLRTLLARRVDGILVTGRSGDPRPSLGPTALVPVVYVLTTSADPSDLSVTHDDGGGATAAVAHLVDTGRRRVALVMGPASHAASRHRADGALLALRRSGLEPVLGGAMFGSWNERWGRDAVAGLLAAGAPFDAVFAASDQIARGVLDALRDSGQRVPEDVGVVGVDNWDVMSEAARPPLTTVDLNLRTLGRTAATRLIEAMEGANLASGVELVPTTLVVRQSTERA